MLTDNEVNLRTEGESQVLVTHELMHLEFLNDAHLCDALQLRCQ